MVLDLNKGIDDSAINVQLSNLLPKNHHQLSIIYFRVGMTRHASCYYMQEVDSGIFYCKNDLGYSHLFKLPDEKALLNDLPEGNNHYQYAKYTGTDVVDEVVISFDSKSVTLYSLSGGVLEILARGDCNFYLNKKIFLDIKNNLERKDTK